MLRLENICAGYGDAVVLRDVSLSVPDGAVVALLGANGAGKTTLLRTASGMIGTTRGAIRMDGVDLTGKPTEVFARAGVGHIPEGRSIFPRMTVRENLLLFSPPGEEHASLALVAEMFPRLAERSHQVAGTLSGGEQQMLALARCYIARPKVLLVDEVSLGLAPMVVDGIFQSLSQMASEGMALLLVEQYVTKALELANYVYILTKGSVAFAGEPIELNATEIFREYIGSTVI